MTDHQLTGCQLTDYQWTGYQELAASCLAASCLVYQLPGCQLPGCQWAGCQLRDMNTVVKTTYQKSYPPNLKARITCALFSPTRPSSTPTMETDMKIVRLRPLRPRWQAGNHQRSLRNATVLQKLKWLGIMPCIWRHPC